MSEPLPRLNRAPGIGHNRPPAPPRYTRTCLECGDAFKSDFASKDFCCDQHKRDFNNRRQKRGADFYDLIMAMRYDRKAAADAQAWTMLCRMAQDFHEQDKAHREGRRSYRKPKTVLARHPHLYAVVTDVSRRK